MFLEVRKNPQVYVQHKDMDALYLAPVTSNFRININHIAEVSTYSIKEVKTKKLLSGESFEIPINSRVIHLEMSYTHSTKWAPYSHSDGRQGQKGVNERYFYKLVFLPLAHDEYLRIRNIIERQTLS
jgi:hypothetical protein